MGQVLTLVKIPLAEVEEWVRNKHNLPSVMYDSRIEDKELVLYFREEEHFPSTDSPVLSTTASPARIRRARKKRNRMRTRGWAIVGRITNSKGLTCSVYKPFVDALKDPNLDVEQQRKITESILRSNKNKPSEASVQYYLDNTLEYLNKPSEGQQ